MQSSPTVRRFDRSRFDRLLDLIGPQETGAFLAQLAQDLSGCVEANARAPIDKDWPALSETSHVLISLAGSVGAMSLQSLAERLNTAAAAGDAKAIADLLADLDSDLADLLAFVQAAAADLKRPNPDGPK